MTSKDFRALSALAVALVPHDEVCLTLWTADLRQAPLFLSTGSVLPGEVDATPPTDRDIVRVMSEEEAGPYGFPSGVRVPLRAANGAQGFLTLLARQPQLYAENILTKASAVADYICAVLTQEDAVARMFDDLLATLARVLDIKEVFADVSEIVSKVLPHDRMTLAYIDADRRLIYIASSNDDKPSIAGLRLKVSDLDQVTESGYKLIGDLTREANPFVDPPDFCDRMVAAGYRSFLVPHVSTRFHLLGLSFWSRQSYAFNLHDLPLARRIAEFVGLVLSHQQLAETAKAAAEAQAKAERLELRVESLTQELDAKSGYGRVIGQSPKWKDVLKRATQVAGTDTTVLLVGDSGTGKEVVARFIHRASPRNRGPLVALNSAALPDHLLESELFGYERGAFTGAHQSKPGQVELAAGGVLFLDEVSEMSRSAQAKLLRLLQEREFQRLGGTRVQKADIRVIAATNRDLKQAVAQGTFREDLYYRLSVFDIQIPPLRSRTGDILLFAEAFLEDFAKSFARPPAGLTRRAKEALLAYSWPGNVRQLRNVLERAAILSDGGLIDADDLSLETAIEPRTTAAMDDLTHVERETIRRVVLECKGNKSKAAKRLGLTRMQLYGRLQKYGIELAS
jgi:transcriptional regulator with GAF, ATPase, and Fis domain